MSPKEDSGSGDVIYVPQEKSGLGDVINVPQEKSVLGDVINVPQEKSGLGDVIYVPQEKSGLGDVIHGKFGFVTYRPKKQLFGGWKFRKHPKQILLLKNFGIINPFIIHKAFSVLFGFMLKSTGWPIKSLVSLFGIAVQLF